MKLVWTAWLVCCWWLLALGAAGQGAGSSPAEAAEAEVRLFLLRDGRTLWGTIERHDEDALRVRKLVGGGLVTLGWGLLEPGQEHELRLLLGYVDEGSDEVLVDADRLVLHDGTEVVGRIVERDGEHVWVQRAGGTVPIPTERIATISLVRANALELYSRDELYQELAGRLSAELARGGEAGAMAHVELAQYAERVLDYAHAAEHYAIAQELAPGHRTDFVTMALERARTKAALQEQVDLLAQADLWRGRGLYARAWEILDAFPKRFPGSPLLEDWNRMRRRVERYQERELRDALVERVHHWADVLTREEARSAESFEAARTWIEDRFADELLAAVHADLQRIAAGITAEDVRRLWDEREGGRVRQASYGLGTWLLGEELALGSSGEEAEEEPEPDTQADARKRLEERIRRYLENQEVLRKNQEKAGTEEDPETFWKSWDVHSRAQWLLAYFVEHGGFFRLDRVRFANCRECAGTGVREIAYAGGAISGQTATTARYACPTCHSLGRVRRVRYL